MTVRLWALLVLPWLARKGTLVTLTAPAPVWHPRHVTATGRDDDAILRELGAHAPARADAASMKVAVVVATKDRPGILSQLLHSLERQTYPHQVILSVPNETSLAVKALPDKATVVYAQGLSAQRNTGLAAAVAAEADLVVMFDDDAVPREDYIANLVQHLTDHPQAVAATGRVLLDGASTPESISLPDSLAAIEASWAADVPAWTDTRELYGCNFGFRVDAVARARFDERLLQYSWLEDHDFARQLMPRGRLHRVPDCVIVHRGVKSGGRVAHQRLGYSQVMNPYYFWRKGTFPFWLLLHETVPRILLNLAQSVRRDEGSARRRRLLGNLVAALDILRGRVTPERMADLD